MRRLCLAAEALVSRTAAGEEEERESIRTAACCAVFLQVSSHTGVKRQRRRRPLKQNQKTQKWGRAFLLYRHFNIL